jgi:hypothetical protein
MIWTATREELREDFALMEKAHHALFPVETSARIAFHDATQEAVKVVTPAPRFIAALMAGGYIKRKRCVGADLRSGLPMFEGDKDAAPLRDKDGNVFDYGKPMGPMTHDEAIAFLAWRDLPPGCNHFKIMSTDDLPRIDGCIDKARKFRAAWRLEGEDA